MAITVAQAQADCVAIFNAMSAGTKTLRYLQKANDYLATKLPLSLTSEDITTIVAGTREYAVSALMKRLWSAEWVMSSADGDSYDLKATSIPALNNSNPSWRRAPQGRPTRRYLSLSGDSVVIGLDPKPNLSTSGGYPLLRLYESRTTTLATDGNLPANILSAAAHVFYACWLHAVDNQIGDRIDTLWNAFQTALQMELDASAAAGFADVQDPPSLTPDWLRVGPAV